METLFTIDKIESIHIEPNKFNNEFGGLMNLRHGLVSLYNLVKPQELRIHNQTPEGTILMMSGNHPSIPPEVTRLLPSLFYWFSLSLTNYARLTGYIYAVEKGILTTEDIGLRPDKDKIKNSVNNYVESVVEIQELIKWRNKIAAHFALTDPRSDDNISTLESSIFYPVAYEETRFWTGTFVLTKGDEHDNFSSDIPRWALTEVFEKLTKRFWPDIRLSS